jgi:DNA-binding NtrC family response regulator
LLTAHFLRQFNEENGRSVEISSAALKALKEYEWPGNVRELENIIKSAATLCDGERVELDDLPARITGDRPQERKKPQIPPPKQPSDLKTYMRNVEAAYIKSVVDDCGGNKEEAAEKLGISIATLYRKMNATQQD